MIAAGTTIVASVQGAFDWLKAPESLSTFVQNALADYGHVITVDVQTALLSSHYTATVTFVLGVDHDSIEDVRGIVAGVFQTWNGLRPAVSIVEPTGEAPQGALHSPALSGLGLDPSKWSGTIWAIVALVVVVVVAPYVAKR